jgi:hypothetical protein
MNSMLATLNTREHLRNKAGIVQSMSLANLSSVGGINSVHQPDNSRSNMGMGIALTEETFVRLSPFIVPLADLIYSPDRQKSD